MSARSKTGVRVSEDVHSKRMAESRHNNTEAAVSSHDAVVELVGITNIHHATDFHGLVTLHV